MSETPPRYHQVGGDHYLTLGVQQQNGVVYELDPSKHQKHVTISYEDWPGFLEFVKEIDVEFNTFGGIGGTQPGTGFPRSGVD